VNPSRTTPDEEERPTRRRGEAILARILVALVALVAAAALAEIASRWLAPNRKILLGFPTDRVPRPYTVFGPAPLDGRVNRLGYRGPVPEMPKGDEFRVFVLGGSTVFLGDPPIPELLERQFREHGFARVRVFNWGAVAASSGMEVARLAFEVGDYAPDLVVAYDGGNDVTTPFLFDPRPGYPLNFLVTESNPLLKGDVGSYPAWTLLAYGSNLARLLFPGFFPERLLPLEKLRGEVGYGSPEWRDAIAADYVANLVRASRIATGFGASFMAFFQPTIHFKSSLSEEERELKDKLVEVLAGGRSSDFDEHARATRERVRARIAALDGRPRVVDLSGIFAETPGWIFTDFIHVRREGNEMIARAVFEQLVADADVRRRLDGFRAEAGRPRQDG
jgi:hypothetical protein